MDGERKMLNVGKQLASLSMHDNNNNTSAVKHLKPVITRKSATDGTVNTLNGHKKLGLPSKPRPPIGNAAEKPVLKVPSAHSITSPVKRVSRTRSGHLAS